MTPNLPYDVAALSERERQVVIEALIRLAVQHPVLRRDITAITQKFVLTKIFKLPSPPRRERTAQNPNHQITK